MDNSGNQSQAAPRMGSQHSAMAPGRGKRESRRSRRALFGLSSRALGVFGSSTLSLVCTVAAAQSPREEPRPQRVSLAYFGERAVQPGLRIGYDAVAWLRRPHELLLAGNISGFAIPQGYALMALFEGGYRATARFGGFLDLRPGLGYTAAWVETGGPPIVSNYLTLAALGGIGYDFFRLLRVPLSVMARSGVLWRYSMPHGTTLAPLDGASYALDVGIAYQFGTGRPKTIALPVATPPYAEAPANLDEPGTAVPTSDPAPAPNATPPLTPEPTSAPVAPTVPSPPPAQ